MTQAKTQYQYVWLNMDNGCMLSYDGTWSVTIKTTYKPSQDPIPMSVIEYGWWRYAFICKAKLNFDIKEQSYKLVTIETIVQNDQKLWLHPQRPTYLHTGCFLTLPLKYLITKKYPDCTPPPPKVLSVSWKVSISGPFLQCFLLAKQLWAAAGNHISDDDLLKN